MKVINKNVQVNIEKGLGIKNLVSLNNCCPEIIIKDLRVTKEILFENSGPSIIPFSFFKFAY